MSYSESRSQPVAQMQQEPPPPYSEGLDLIWRFRNVKYQSSFVNSGPPTTQDFRDHLASIKVTHPGDELATSTSPSQAPQYNVSYMQALGQIAKLLEILHECSVEVRPLGEDDLLFLLLSRYAEQSGTNVYAEIQRPQHMQIFDSTIAEPHHTDTMQDYLNDAPGILAAEVTGLSQGHIDVATTKEPGRALHTHTPTESEVPCTITINYPAIIPRSIVQNGFSSATLNHTPQLHNNIYPPNDWSQIPEKLQPPTFHVHRCHHEGVTSSAVGQVFELPSGFPEIVHCFNDTPKDFYHAAFFIKNRSRLSPPTVEGGLQSFECHVASGQECLYVTVRRDGDTLLYNCFKDQELWAQSHEGHEECSGC